MSRILAIDPGPEESAWVHYDPARRIVVGHNKRPNAEVLDLMRTMDTGPRIAPVIEMIASYGMPVGREVFETCVWIGRFVEAWDGRCDIGDARVDRLFRRDVKMHLCGNNTAKDSNIRCALVDRFGPGKDKAVGRKANPGPLFGLAGDEWAALAVAVTYADRMVVSSTNNFLLAPGDPARYNPGVAAAPNQ